MAKALIIDDNEMNRDTLRILLRREGMEAICLASPYKLEDNLTVDFEIAVVFLDLEFPNYDGLKLIDDLRHMPKLANSPIIAYSVHISEQEEVRQAGFDGFIGKPLNVSKFPAQLQSILNGELVWDAGQ